MLGLFWSMCSGGWPYAISSYHEYKLVLGLGLDLGLGLGYGRTAYAISSYHTYKFSCGHPGIFIIYLLHGYYMFIAV